MLPLGTIVRLKDDDGVYMIIKRYVITPAPNDEVGYFEYKACYYPAGYTEDDENSIFNQEDIEEILYLGYESDSDKEYLEEIMKYIGE